MQVAKLAPPIVVDPVTQDSFARDGTIIGLGISGGGMRAASFTLGAFSGLAEIRNNSNGPSAMQLVDFASANSGGSWALAAYLVNRNANFDEFSRRFANAAAGPVGCWAERFTTYVTGPRVLGEFDHQRPRPYFNATLLPAHLPFVFTQQFVDAYKIRHFHSQCDRLGLTEGMSAAQLPLGYAAATSGSVPGFTHSYVETNLCAEGTNRPNFCAADPALNSLKIVDGGLYDNLGYKTAWEYALAAGPEPQVAHKLVLLIDSKDGWAIPTMTFKDASQPEGLSAAKLLLASTFPLQNATFLRLSRPMFEAIGYQSIVLDFDAASDFSDALPVRIDDLPDLMDMAADQIDCLDRNGRVLSHKLAKRPAGVSPIDWLKQRGGDCLANNFARVGYNYPTTYAFNENNFAAGYQLGLLTVRMHQSEIRHALGWS
jgi:Patatin-like phospholipase